MEELMAGYKLDQGLRQVLSIMTLLVYNLFAIYMLSHQEGNLKLCEEILEEQLQVMFVFSEAINFNCLPKPID